MSTTRTYDLLVKLLLIGDSGMLSLLLGSLCRFPLVYSTNCFALPFFLMMAMQNIKSDPTITTKCHIIDSYIFL